MIISASRRTDIPAFYSEWLIRRVQKGYCNVPNPLNKLSVSRVSLRPEDVDAMVFWTRWPLPLLGRLDELERYIQRYYFLFTIVGYPREIDPGSPAVSRATDVFRRLAERTSPERVIWRYDPIVFSDSTGIEYHEQQVEKIAKALAGSTRRVVFSLRDDYRKAEGRASLLRGTPLEFREAAEGEAEILLEKLAQIVRHYGIEPVSCAEETDFSDCGVRPGSCVDGELLRSLWPGDFSLRKDSGQRSACGCVQSRDIGMYDSCQFGCSYCYATTSFSAARVNLGNHNPESPSLVGWMEATTGKRVERGVQLTVVA